MRPWTDERKAELISASTGFEVVSCRRYISNLSLRKTISWLAANLKLCFLATQISGLRNTTNQQDVLASSRVTVTVKQSLVFKETSLWQVSLICGRYTGQAELAEEDQLTDCQ